jgi:deoxyribonuclease-4
MWKASDYSDEDVAAFKEALDASPIAAVLIHGSYLCNCASEDREIRTKSLASLVASLRAGAAIGSAGVVLHPGSAKGGAAPAAVKRAGATIAEALAQSDGCPLHLENTAGAGATLGRSIDELQALIEVAGGDARLGVCLDSCHLFASGYDVRTRAGMDALVARVHSKLGAQRLGSLHLNDSATALGSNRDRHADLGAGELGEAGLSTFLGAPGLQGLPCVLETPGPDRKGADAAEVALAKRLHKRGVKAYR